MPLFLIGGNDFRDETVRDGEKRLAPLLADQVRRRRPGRVGRCWYVDET
jgi:transposase-like protein